MDLVDGPPAQMMERPARRPVVARHAWDLGSSSSGRGRLSDRLRVRRGLLERAPRAPAGYCAETGPGGHGSRLWWSHALRGDAGQGR